MKRTFILACFLTLSQITFAFNVKHKPAADSGVTAKRDTNLFVPVVNNPSFSAYQNSFKRRLDSVQREVPLNYNEFVQTYIDLYTAPGRKNDIARVLGLAKYYFPIYEKAFREAGIPEEIKFLSIVESELNPFAISRTGAVGPWQFMPTTGKGYGLLVDDNVDERRDPIKASYAAAAYLKNAYQEFGDWLLAIASYNCGTSSVERAIDKAGATDFWAIRQYLPNETRGYVPAFIAMSYVMNYPGRHNIFPIASSISKADTMMVNKPVSLANIARLLNMDAKDISLLNPSYKRGVINATASAPRRLIVPQVRADQFAVLYEALNSDAPMPLAPATPMYAVAPAQAERRQAAVQRPAYHIVKKGETLAGIADRYGVDVQDLKAWNNLHSNKPVVGKKLKLGENLVNNNRLNDKSSAKASKV